MIRALVLALVAACGATPASPQPIGNTGGVNEPVARPARPPAPASGAGDRDGDGVTDDADQCAEIPEDYDGFEDSDGCPDADNDQDRIIDVDDLCPNEPEVKDGNTDDDGCPP